LEKRQMNCIVSWQLIGGNFECFPCLPFGKRDSEGRELVEQVDWGKG
jgi:hypothetical protein